MDLAKLINAASNIDDDAKIFDFYHGSDLDLGVLIDRCFSYVEERLCEVLGVSRFDAYESDGTIDEAIRHNLTSILIAAGIVDGETGSIGSSGRAAAALEWSRSMFGEMATGQGERAARFLEEALEVVAASGLSRGVAERLLNRAYNLPQDDIRKEIGQAGFTLELLAQSLGYDLEGEVRREWARVRSIDRQEWRRRQNGKADLGMGERASE